MKFQKILISTDLSEHSLSLVNRLLPSLVGVPEVTLTTCVESQVFPIEDVHPWQIFGALKESWILKSKAALDKICAQISPQSTHQTLIASASVADEICNFAKRGNYDLLIIGSHGAGVLTTLALGSTANRIIQNSPCPVMVLPNRILDTERPLDLKNAHVLTAAELSKDSLILFDAVASVLENDDRTTLITVLTQMSFPTWPLGDEKPPTSLAEYFAQRKPQAQKHLEKLANMYFEGKRVDCNVLESSQSVAEMLCNYAHSVGANCIAIGSRGAGILDDLIIGSTVQNILRLSSLPVFLFPLRTTK